MCNLVPFVQFKKREKHPCNFVKSNTPLLVFSRFLKCTNATKYRNASHFRDPMILAFYNIVQKRLQHRCFPVNITKYLRTPILKSIYKSLFLNWRYVQYYSSILTSIYLVKIDIENPMFNH